MPALITYDIEITQGAKYTRTFAYLDSNGAPIPLTGRKARMQVRPSKKSDQVLLELTTENGMLVVNGAAGTVDIVIGATKSSPLTKGGVYDLELPMISDPDDVIRFAEGAFNLDGECTR